MTVPDLTIPILNLHGEKVALGPLCRDLIPSYTRWINEFEGQFTFSTAEPITQEQRTASYERWTRDLEDSTFTIYEATTLRPVGMTGIWLPDRFAHSGFIFILIGEKACRGRGYGGEAMALIMEYGFQALNLHSVETTVVASNIAGVRAYQRAGFRVIGRRREAIRVGSRVEDFLYMGCLADEFHRPALTWL